MQKATLYSLFLLCCGASATGLAGQRADIRQLETDFNAAYAANDVDKYFGFYANDAIFWFPEGRTDTPKYQKEWSEFLKSGGAIKAGSDVPPPAKP